MNRPRCHACSHPGRHRRRVTDRKPACSCTCHQPATTFDAHRWPAWVTGDIQFEEVA